ncbi:MAG: L-fuculokinase, partial [Candidatus Limnocylindrales bacterium]
MSLIGIDLGTSGIKVGAFSADGVSLAEAFRPVPNYHPEPGRSEVDVFEHRVAFRAALEEVAAHPSLKGDPPVAISFSSSGREVFPVAQDGTPLGRCLMTADMRGDEVAAVTAARRSEEEWQRLAGHVPRRMDPVNRALWWRQTDPATAARTRWFMNWHEYYALLLSGRPVIDWSDAGTWATYDVATGAWSPERIAETGIDPRWLPEIQPNATPIGPILAGAARDFGLPVDTLIVTGAFDTYAASVGSAAIDPGIVSLACGTWNSYNMAVNPGWPPELVHDGIGVYPHPGPTGFGLLVTNPNGMAVIDWARDLLHLSIADLETGLAAAGPGPGRVFADARFTP